MKSRPPQQNTPRVIGLAVAFFAVLFLLVPADERFLLSWFVAAFAVLALAMDPQLRAALPLRRRSAGRRRVLPSRPRANDGASSALDA